LVNLISCELLKIKRSKVLLISLLGILSTPFMKLVEVLQIHFRHPEQIITLEDIYDSSLIYVMLLMNMMVYTVIAAYLFSREYTENTLKTIIPIPISKTKFVIGKFCILFLWIMALTIVTWAGILLSATFYHLAFGMERFEAQIAVVWLGKMLLGGLLMFLTISPFSFIAERTRGLVGPMIAATVVVMGSVALSNQDIGALYPWTAIFFLIKGKIVSTGYPVPLAIGIITLVSIIGFVMTFIYFNKEDVK